MKIKQLSTLFFAALGFLFLISCDDEVSEIITEEAVKDITGSWKVIQLTRNGEDLSKRMNLTDFRLDFKENGTYSVASELPFVLEGEGTYKLNDPQYPFTVLMTSAESTEEVAVKFQFPVVKGKRQLSLSFSLGCSSNTYQYNFEREN